MDSSRCVFGSSRRAAAARSTTGCGHPLHQPRKHSGLSAPAGDAGYHYKIVMFGKINFWECRIFFAGGRGPWRGTGMRGDCLSLLEGVAMIGLAPDVGLSICPTRFIATPLKPSTHDGAAAKTRSRQPCRPQEIRAASPASINRGGGV